jgi:hypothetical protein
VSEPRGVMLPGWRGVPATLRGGAIEPLAPGKPARGVPPPPLYPPRGVIDAPEQNTA